MTQTVFKIPNELKLKLGMRVQANKPGQIDPKLIAQAQAVITEQCASAHEAIGENLTALAREWSKMKTMPESLERALSAKKIFTLAHEIKDIGGLSGHSLIAYFGESLRDYIEQTTLNLKNQHIIIQAHVDAMHTAHKNKLREDGGPGAEELKRIVKIAIERYH